MACASSICRQFVEGARRLLRGGPYRVQVAALPWRMSTGEIEVMLVTSRGTGRWVLPKGWPEQGETLSQSAAREAQEEGGLAGTIASLPTGRYYYRKLLDSGVELPCEVQVFSLEVSAVADEWPEKDQRERQWFAPSQAAELVAEADLARLIGGFVPEKSAA